MDKNQMEKQKKQHCRNYAPLVHLSILLSSVFWGLAIIVGLVTYLASSNPRAQAAGREVLNYYITFFLIPFILIGLVISLAGIPVALFMIILLVPYALLMFFVFPIIAAVKSANGIDYKYPLTIRLLKS